MISTVLIEMSFEYNTPTYWNKVIIKVCFLNAANAAINTFIESGKFTILTLMYKHA